MPGHDKGESKSRSVRITALKILLIYCLFIYAYSYFDDPNRGYVIGIVLCATYIVANDYWSPHSHRFVIGAAFSLTLLELPLLVLIPWQNIGKLEILAIFLLTFALTMGYFKLLHKFASSKGWERSSD
jgi:hypothetical protein